MRRFSALGIRCGLGWLVAALVVWPQLTWSEQRWVVGNDGSIAGHLEGRSPKGESAVLHFGLPPTDPIKRWQEGDVLRGLWSSNGIRYTQTSLVRTLGAAATDRIAGGSGVPVLLVNIEGENTLSDYAEASATLTLEVHGHRQELELKNGLIWRRQGDDRWLFGALDVPESGVKVANGPALQFSGNMPPGIKGALTLKVPLEPTQSQAVAEQLKDLDFGDELFQALKTKRESATASPRFTLVVAGDQPAARTAESISGPGPVPEPALKPSDVLSIREGRFFLEGKPFVEISFNKFDLFWQLYDQLVAGRPLERGNPLLEAQDRALRDLHELGFRTIRIFALPWGPEGPASYANPEKRKKLYAALDKTLELCDSHQMRVVWSLGAGAFTDTILDPGKGWVYGDEHLRELVANPESRSRKLLYRYLDETVARYRDRKAVAMWEISNEVTLQADIGDRNRVYNGERMPTLPQVARFFDEVAQRIKSVDPLRLVSSGGSNLRESQWHLYQSEGWKRDTFEEQFKCFELLYAHSAVDVVDIHSYPNHQPGYLIKDEQGKDLWLDNNGYMAMARRLGKPLMIGELGLQPAPKSDQATWSAAPDYFESFDDTPAAKRWLEKTLTDVIEARVPLTYWWCYQADRPDDQANRQRLDIDRSRNPELVNCIVAANRRLQALAGVGAPSNAAETRTTTLESGRANHQDACD